MSKLIDLAGQKFGDLTVKESAGTDKHKNRLWLCECICGNTVKVRSTLLTLGLKDNCGCKSLKKQNLINQKFGNLTVKKFAGYDKHKNRLWLCECTCGNKVKVATTYLITGQKVNCGCKGARKPNLVNRKFGDLTVKKFAGINKKGSRLWLCECTCGETVITPTHYLTSGQKTHCGCKSNWKQNLVNQKFGDLTVKEFAGCNKYRNRLWLCECTCGNKVKVTSARLISGRKTHCGCKVSKGQVFINQKFGNLTVKEFAGLDKSRNRLWLCECTCGNKVKVTSARLISGRKTHCGCKVSKGQNLVNRKFGDLTVKEFAGLDKSRNRLWLCECTCGATVKVASNQLTSGQKTHCGCKNTRKQNLINQKFGDLTVKELAGSDKWRRRTWLCECTCGNTVKVASNQLTSGQKTHCGCKSLKKQVFINQKFGNLTVKEFAGLDKRGNRIWLCECTCGGTVITPTHYLTSGRKTHCGCKRGYNRVFLDQRAVKEKNASLYKKYIERKNRKKFIMPSLEEIKIWDKKFTILELIKKKLRETSNMDELDSFLTLLSTKKINM